LPFGFYDQLLDGTSERRQVLLDDVPGSQCVGALIFVPQQIADCSDLTPGNVSRQRLQFVRDMAAGLRDNLQPAFDGALRRPATGEPVKRNPCG
jgi:hypothetical protein